MIREVLLQRIWIDQIVRRVPKGTMCDINCVQPGQRRHEQVIMRFVLDEIHHSRHRCTTLQSAQPLRLTLQTKQRFAPLQFQTTMVGPEQIIDRSSPETRRL